MKNCFADRAFITLKMCSSSIHKNAKKIIEIFFPIVTIQNLLNMCRKMTKEMSLFTKFKFYDHISHIFVKKQSLVMVTNETHLDNPLFNFSWYEAKGTFKTISIKKTLKFSKKKMT